MSEPPSLKLRRGWRVVILYPPDHPGVILSGAKDLS